MSEGIVLYGLGSGARTPRGSFGQRVIRLNDRVIRIPDIDERLRKLHGKVVRMKAKRKMINVEITRESVKHIRNSIEKGYIDFSLEDLARIDRKMPSAEWKSHAHPDRKGRHAKSNKTDVFEYFSFNHNDKELFLNINHKKFNMNGRIIYKYILHDITKKIKN